MSSTVEIILLGKDQTSGVISAVGKSVGGLGSIMHNALGFVTGGLISKGMGLVGDAIGGIKAAMIDGNAEFERYETQFGVLLGSADAAKQRLGELAEFGAKTPFELPEVVRADKILQAFGLHSEDVAKKFGMSGVEIRTVAGDVAAGTGASFEEISTYLGKFASGATGEAIARMQELGIVTRAELTKMGLEFSKSGQLMSPIDESMGVLLTAMKGKFGGMMDAQSSTFEGMISNLQDWLGQTGRIIGKPIFDVLKNSLKGLLGFLGSPAVMEGLTGFANMMAGSIQSTIDTAIRLGQSLAPTVDALGDFFAALQAGDKVAFDSSDEYSRLAEVLLTLGIPDDVALGISDAINNIIGSVSPAVDAFGDFFAALQAGEKIAFDSSDEFSRLAELLATLGVPDDVALGISDVFNTINGAIGVFQKNIAGGRDIFASFARALFSIGGDDTPAVFVSIGQAVQGLGQAFADAQVLLGQFGTEFGTVLKALQSGDTAPLVAMVQKWAGILLNWVSTDVIPFIGAKIGELVNTIGQLIATYAPVIISKLIEWETAWLNFLVTGVIPFIGARISELVSTIGTWVTNNAPVIGAQLAVWANAFLDWVGTSVIPFLSARLEALITAVGAWITTNAPVIGAKLTEWGTAFLNWIQNDVVPFIAPKLETLIAAIGAWITTNVPIIGAKLLEWGTAFLNWVSTDVIPFIAPKLEALITAIGNWVIAQIPIISARVAEWASSFLSWVDTDVVPFMAPKLATIWTAISTWVSAQGVALGTLISGWGASFTQWINDLVPQLPGKLLAIWTALYNWIQTTVSDVTQHSAEIAEAITKWINEKAVPWLRTEFPKFVLVLVGLIVAIPLALVATLAIVALAVVNGIIDGMKKYVNEKVAELINIGKDMIAGLVKGLEASANSVFEAFKKIIGDAFKDVKNFFGFKSPPPIAIQMGADIAKGFALGALSGMEMLSQVMRAGVGSAFDAAQGALASLPPISLGGATGTVAANGATGADRASAQSAMDHRPLIVQVIMDGDVISQRTYPRISELFNREVRGEYA